jgi:crotonobetainyl-CoA:carnitine CoA-transferase CaiB-like acyl-CoA transferase
MSPYKRLVGVLGDKSLLSYDNPRDLFEKRDEIWGKVAALTKTRTTAELMQSMLDVDIWCGEVKSHLAAERDPQVQHMRAITTYDHPVAGTVKVVAPAVKLSKTPAEITRPAPLIGEHSCEILEEFGFGRDQIDRWLHTGSVAQAEVESR